jgi:hypothetical protein
MYGESKGKSMNHVAKKGRSIKTSKRKKSFKMKTVDKKM